MRRKRPATLTACSSNVRRRSSDHATAVTRDTSPWASLHWELVSLIGNRVLAGDYRDYIRFRAVCPHWRLSTVCPRGRGVVDPRFHPRRWMIFPEGDGLYPGHRKMRGYIRFFNISTGAFVRVLLPLFRDHCLLESMDGILLLRRKEDTAIRLLNPFTGDIQEFPPLNTLDPFLSSVLPFYRLGGIRYMVAASISVNADGVVRVMMMPVTRGLIFFASSGDKQWNVSLGFSISYFYPYSFQGKLYMLNRTKFSAEIDIFQIDHEALLDSTSSKLSLPKYLIAKCPATSGVPQTAYLVECDSELLVLTRSFCNDHQPVLVYKLTDLILGRTAPVTSIGDNTIFLGNRSLCVNSKAFPTVVADTIFFRHAHISCLEQYHLGTGTLSPTIGRATFVQYPTSIIYHIYSCCYHEHWYNGQIMYGNKVKRNRRAGM